MELKTEYKGYIIKWDDFDRAFNIVMDDTEIKQGLKTVEECRVWIDKKGKESYRCVPVLHKFWRDYDKKVIGKAEATSIIDEEHVWVVSGRQREKVSIKDVWLDTPENIAIIETIQGKRSEIERLEKEITTLERSTARLTTDMMIVK